MSYNGSCQKLTMEVGHIIIIYEIAISIWQMVLRHAHITTKATLLKLHRSSRRQNCHKQCNI